MSDILTEADEALTDFECEYAHCKMPGLVERLAEDLLESNHRCLDLQYQLDDMDKENRKLRKAVIEERAIQKSYFMNDILDEMRDNWKYNFPTDEDKQECRDQAEAELRAAGVIK